MSGAERGPALKRSATLKCLVTDVPSFGEKQNHLDPDHRRRLTTQTETGEAAGRLCNLLCNGVTELLQSGLGRAPAQACQQDACVFGLLEGVGPRLSEGGVLSDQVQGLSRFMSLPRSLSSSSRNRASASSSAVGGRDLISRTGSVGTPWRRTVLASSLTWTWHFSLRCP